MDKPQARAELEHLLHSSQNPIQFRMKSPRADVKLSPTTRDGGGKTPIAAAMQAQADAQSTEPHCYMCMDTTNGSENSAMELIAPCLCQSFVHRKCLDHWRVTSFTYNAMTECPTCREQYHFDQVIADDTDDLKKQIFQARLWRFAIVLGVVFLGGFVLALIDAGTPKFFNLHWNALNGKIYHWIGMTKVPRFVVYFLLSFAMTVLITGVVFILGWCWREGICQGCANVYYDATYPCGSYEPCPVDDDCCGDCGADFAFVVFVVTVVCAVVAGIVLLCTAVLAALSIGVESATFEVSKSNKPACAISAP
ncbi:unnamed protein product [Aphanomyces euteiches]|uniref:Uncharacterized protein n=1 Tax=Aphanomyces euteiches TaxID=100861 RepID=A0A6G0WG72_9STRA|nr:hypothetical protein Ae201684_015616 [Aphanomyces euteiches]KAH9084014.1 hypothetical protein Ae201684P_020277 [Aphanomyces euteiches]KAH9153730.1 hypothetical protein AeRB84_004074 [Aphanomyces euteiches]